MVITPTASCRCGRGEKESLKDSLQRGLVQSFQQRLFIRIANLNIGTGDHTFVLVRSFEYLQFFTIIADLVGYKIVVTMAFDPLIRLVVRTGERYQKMAASSNGDQAITSSEIVFDAVPDPLLAIAGAFAGDDIRLAAKAPDVGKDGFALEGGQFGFFVLSSHEVQLLVKGPGDMQKL